MLRRIRNFEEVAKKQSVRYTQIQAWDGSERWHQQDLREKEGAVSRERHFGSIEDSANPSQR